MALSTADRAHARSLWEAGLSSLAIAAALRTTKSAIVGYAHREGWGARPSPIKRAPDGVPAPAKPKPPPRLHPASVLQNFAAVPVPATRVRSGGVTPVARELAPAQPPAPRVHPTQCCTWPMWGDAERTPNPPRYCDAPVRMKRNEHGELIADRWCAAHAERGYVRSAAGYATRGQIDRLMQTAA